MNHTKTILLRLIALLCLLTAFPAWANLAPSVYWFDPSNNSTYVPGANILLKASAVDSDGTIAKVDFYSGTTLIGTSTTPVGTGYSFTWTNVPAGTHSLTAVATDNLGATKTTTPATTISVDVANNLAPSVYWFDPSNNSTHAPGANILLKATAVDSDGTIAKVDFYSGTTLIGTSTTPVGTGYSFTWVNVSAGTYSLTAKATDNLGGTRTTSPATTITVATVPGAPVIGTATGGNAQASVSFTPPASNGGSTITGYTVTSSPGNLTASGTASPISITGLTNGTAYTFTVKATNAVGTGAASAASNSVTPSSSQIQVPDAPTIGTATAGNAQATVAFTAPANNGGSPITGYTVTSSPGNLTASGAASPLTVTGLTNGTAYTFTVKATNAAGTGAASSASNSVTPATVPGAPTIGTATGGNAQASVSFTPPASNGGSTITGYTVTSSPGNFTASGAASPLTVTGLTNGTAYTFTVKATNAAGTGAASTASNSVTPATVPGAPTIGTATGGNAQASVSFTPPASNGGSTITSYTVTSSPGNFTASGAASPLTVTGLTNGTAYTFTVKATNAAGTGAASNASNSVTPATAPNNLAPSVYWFDPSNNSTYVPGANILLKASAVDSDGTIAKVDFYSGTTLIGTSTTPVGTGYSFTWTNVPAGTHSLTAVATDNLGATKTTTPATTISVDVANNVPPNVYWYNPSNNATYVPGANITLTATAVDSDGTVSKVDFYNGTTLIGTSTIPVGTGYSFTWVNVPAGTYSLTAKATDNLGGTRTTSPATTITVATVPGAPVIGIATAGNAQATVAFTAPANNGGSPITGYTVTSTPGNLTASGAASPISITGLTNGTAYTFTVKATNAVGTGALSAASNSVTPSAGGSQAYYIHADQLDTPRMITNGAGTVVWQWDNSDPFGANMANENPAGQGTFSFNLRFPGQYFDRETNLNYNVNRDYDPAIGRYVQSDPIGLAGGINTYAYVGGNPLIFTDSDGLETKLNLFEGASGAGHLGLQIGNDPSMGKYPQTSDGATRLENLLGIDVPGKIAQDDPTHLIDSIKFQTTPEQEAKLRGCISSFKDTSYNLYGNSCVAPPKKCLNEIGIRLDSSIIPKVIFRNLKNLR